MRKSATRNRRIGAMAGACVALLAACGGDSPRLAGAVRTPPLTVGGLSVPQTDLSGTRTEGELVPPAGELLLVNFGYTFCPDVCPTTMNDISVALSDLADDQAERVTVAMISVDPERDTEAVLTDYLGHFFDDAIAISISDPEVLAAAGSTFGAQWQIAEHEPGDEYYDVAHTAVTYVVDDTGTVVVEWPFGFTIDSMSSDLSTLLKKA